MRSRWIELITALQHKYRVRSATILLCALVGGSCAQISEVRLSAEDRLICMKERDLQGRYVMRMSPFNSACMDYGAPERIRGVWFSGFEEGRFVEGAKSLPKKKPRYRTHLASISNTSDRVVPNISGRTCNEVFYMEFIGRRAVREYGRAGVHKLGPGMADDEIEVIQVDRVLNWTSLGFVGAEFGSGQPLVPC